MENKIVTLPRWCLVNKFPAFYDTESLTAVEQTARIYGKMNELIESYNNYVDNINTTLQNFINETNSDQEAFEVALRQEFQDFIDTANLKIQELEYYLKTNLSAEIRNLWNELNQNGDIQELINQTLQELITVVENQGLEIAEFKTQTTQKIEKFKTQTTQKIEKFKADTNLISPQMYGGIGDGTGKTIQTVYGSVANAKEQGYFTTLDDLQDSDTVDFASIQECVNLGRLISIPKGDYRLSRGIKLKSYTKIQGQNATLSLVNGGSEVFIIDGCKFITIEGLNFNDWSRYTSTAIKVGQMDADIWSYNIAIKDCFFIGFNTAIDFGNVYFVNLDNLRVEYCINGFNTFQTAPNCFVCNQVSFFACMYTVRLNYSATAWTFNSCTFEGSYLNNGIQQTGYCILATCYAVTFNSCYFEYIAENPDTQIQYEAPLWIGNGIVYPTSISLNACNIIGNYTRCIEVYGVNGLTINSCNLASRNFGIAFICTAQTNPAIKKDISIKSVKFTNTTNNTEEPNHLFYAYANNNTEKDVTTIANTNWLMDLTKNSVMCDWNPIEGIWNDDDIDAGDIITWNVGNIRRFKRKLTDGRVVTGAVQETLHGTTAQRLSNEKPIGYMYFDTTLNKPIWWNGTNWVDATGQTV